jgi:hypothetical protein
MGLDLTSFDPMLKDHYAPGAVANLAYQKNKALGMLRKSNKKPGGGRRWIQPIQFGLPGGGSSTFATAMAAANNASQYEAFEVPRVKHYRKGQVDNETIEATASGDMDAFDKAFDEFDNVIEAEANWLNFRFFRSKVGEVGRMTNTVFTTAILTLDDAAGTWGVRQGDVIRLINPTGPALRAGSTTVVSVQRSAGTITLAANIDVTYTGETTLDFVALDGDFNLAPSGLADWIPDTAPTSTPFFGVDRTVEPEMLGGLRVDGSDGRSVADLLVDMVVEADNLGGDPDIVFMNPRAAGQLTKQLEGRWVIQQAAGYNGSKIASIGYRGWQVNLEGHEVTIFTERCCPVKRVHMLSWDTLTMFSAGPAPNFLQKRAGSIIKVSEASDGYEARVGEYMNFACGAPGWNVTGILA